MVSKKKSNLAAIKKYSTWRPGNMGNVNRILKRYVKRLLIPHYLLLFEYKICPFKKILKNEFTKIYYSVRIGRHREGVMWSISQIRYKKYV